MRAHAGRKKTAEGRTPGGSRHTRVRVCVSSVNRTLGRDRYGKGRLRGNFAMSVRAPYVNVRRPLLLERRRLAFCKIQIVRLPEVDTSGVGPGHRRPRGGGRRGGILTTCGQSGGDWLRREAIEAGLRAVTERLRRAARSAARGQHAEGTSDGRAGRSHRQASVLVDTLRCMEAQLILDKLDSISHRLATMERRLRSKDRARRAGPPPRAGHPIVTLSDTELARLSPTPIPRPSRLSRPTGGCFSGGAARRVAPRHR